MYGNPHALILGSTTIAQLTDVSPSTNISHMSDMGAGQFAPQFLGSTMHVPDITFRTRQIASILGLCSSGNQYLCADLSGGNVDLWYRSIKSQSLREADNDLVHLRARCEANAFFCWTGFSASQNGEANIAGIVKPIYNGTNLPLVFTSALALNGTSTAAEQYAMGPVKINGSFLTQVESVNWENNPVYDDIQHAAQGMNVFTAIDTFSPVIRIVTRDLAYAASIAFGSVLSGTGIEVFLRARASGGLNIANATTSHIKFVAPTGKVSVNGITGLRGAVEIVVHLARSASVVFTPSVGVAIA